MIGDTAFVVVCLTATTLSLLRTSLLLKMVRGATQVQRLRRLGLQVADHRRIR